MPSERSMKEVLYMGISHQMLNVRSMSGSSNIKPIFHVLPHVTENFVISLAQAIFQHLYQNCLCIVTTDFVS